MKAIQQQLDSQPRTRSEARAILESFDGEALTLQTSDIKRLSRMHAEDLFQLTQGSPLKLYVSKDAALNTQEWLTTTFLQAIEKVPGASVTSQINGDSYHCFHVNILNASIHDEIMSGLATEKKLFDYFVRNEGFSVSFGGTDDHTLTVSWKQVIQYSSSIMFFGPPSNRNRVYSDVIAQIIKDAQASRRDTRLIPEPEHVEETDWMLECQEMSRFN